MRFVPSLGTILTVAALAACQAPVQHGLDEPAANEIVAALERAGIGAAKAREEGADKTFVVRVGSSDAVRALEVLRASGLPRGAQGGFARVYAQPSLVPTATEERARYVDALAGEIEGTLETVEGVADARVHLVLPETDPLAPDDKPRVPPQAAILLKVARGAPPIKETDVQRLVAGSVPALRPEAVAVVMTAAPEPPAASTPTVPLGPLRVAPGSRGWLLGGLAAALIVLAALAGLLLYTARRLSALERALAERPEV